MTYLQHLATDGGNRVSRSWKANDVPGWSMTIAAVLTFLWLGPMHESHGQHSSAEAVFELVDGDRVVLVGNTFIEAAQEHGYIELALTTRWPDRNVIFRNVGWAGDTVFGDARKHVTDPPGPYERLLEEISAPDPSVLIVGYGSNVPFEGDGARSRFEEGLNRLLGDLERETDARIVLLAPPPHEADMSPVPADVVRKTNESLERVADVIGRVAGERGHWFADVFSALEKIERETSTPITSDGVHLNAVGYYYLAHAIEEALGLPRRGWAVTLNLNTGQHTAEAARVEAVDAGGNAATISLHSNYLPVPRPTTLPDAAVPPAYGRQLSVEGLQNGTYTLTFGETRLASASADTWATGVTLAADPDSARSEQLRRLIVEKNRLHFHQYRPQNETYLIGFRSYEQGENAAELSHFSPLIDEKELEIGRLRMAVPLTLKFGPTEDL